MEPPPSAHRIILADNQAIFRAGSARVIERAPDMRVAAECDDASRLPHLLAEYPGAILLLAHTLPIDLEEIIHRAHDVGTRVMLLTENGQKLSEAMRAPIDYVLSRNTTGDHLLDCIRSAARGERCTELPDPPPETADAVGLRIRGQLTPRELQIMGLVVQGLKNKEVAAELNTQEQVVKNYLRSIYDKTGVSDRLELALFVLHHRVLAEAASRSVGTPRSRPL